MKDLYDEFNNMDPLNRRDNPFLPPGNNRISNRHFIIHLNSNANFFRFSIESDPFYELQESHSLIGVANIYMDALFHDVNLNYHLPIISQQGKVAGKFQV